MTRAQRDAHLQDLVDLRHEVGLLMVHAFDDEGGHEAARDAAARARVAIDDAISATRALFSLTRLDG